MTDLVTELVQLVNAYHWRWVAVHGAHGLECELCAGLNERHAWTLAAFEAELGMEIRLEPLDEPLEPVEAA